MKDEEKSIALPYSTMPENLCNVHKSAVKPKANSFAEKKASLLQNQMWQAITISVSSSYRSDRRLPAPVERHGRGVRELQVSSEPLLDNPRPPGDRV